MWGQALRAARTALFRRTMSTGRMPDHIGEGGNPVVSVAYITTSCFFLRLKTDLVLSITFLNDNSFWLITIEGMYFA